MSEGGSTRRPRRRTGAGLASALAGAALLVVLGFALGIVGGLVMEEPALLLDYVAGRARTVALEPGPALPPVAAPPPPAPTAAEAPAPREEPAAPTRTASANERGAAGVVAPVAPREPAPAAPALPAAAPAPAPPPEVAALEPAAAPARGFAVQVGAFADAAGAEQLARKLRGQGLPVYVAPSAGEGAKWRVRVGPLPTRPEADQIAARLKAHERLPTWVLAESP